MIISLVRHGRTEGNQRRAFVGSLNQPVSPQGMEHLAHLLKTCEYPSVERVYCSPLLRCGQTAETLYPGHQLFIVEDLQEQHFGDFEGLTFEEITAQPGNENWGNTLEAMEFPGGETREGFCARVLSAFRQIVREAAGEGFEQIAIVTHGGAIMSVMERLCTRRRYFHDWWCDNGSGYQLRLLDDGRVECLDRLGEKSEELVSN